jgi:predicted ATPase
MNRENYYVITGGPGMGKTSLIDELRHRGYTCVPETGRDIIQQQVVNGGNALPWGDRSEFARLMFRQSVLDFTQQATWPAPVFFDRGIADTIGYLELCGLPVPEEMRTTARALCFNTQVFMTPPWEEIYCHDKERKQSFEEAVRTYEMIKQVYFLLGYTIVTLPKTTIAARIEFILASINKV